MEGPRPLVAVHSAEFRPSDGQVAVGAKTLFVNEAMEGAVHGLDLILFPLHIHLVEHALLVKVVVPGSLPQVQVRDVGSVQQIVPARYVLVLPKVFHNTPHGRPLGMPEHESPPGVFLDREEVKLLAEHTVVPFLRFLQFLLVHLELLRGFPSCTVNARQHIAFLVPPPVRPRHGLQRDGFGRNVAGGVNMRPPAEVPPLRLLDALADVPQRNGCVRCSCDDRIQNLQLVRLIYRGNASTGFLNSNELFDHRIFLLDDLVHSLLDLLEILLRKWTVRLVKIVVEAVVDPGTDGNLDSRV
mmetsp:Transcript_8871/g.11306  ORF Transcript_8871/g.11306 Transcript_8871/m.11306 type:complete len:299 (-) Transcript_8871:324-1220(-)